MPFIRLAFVCLLSLFLAVSVQANEPEKVPSLQDAKTTDDVIAEMLERQRAMLRERHPEIDWDSLQIGSTRTTASLQVRSFNGGMTTITAEISPEGFERFKSEIKERIGRREFAILDIANVIHRVPEMNGVPSAPLIRELIEHVRTIEGREGTVVALEGLLRRATGGDPKLYGRTLDDKEFDWESLRGKYVLIKFTGTWCGPCHAHIPSMLEAYEKYHDKGFDIISVYTWQRESDPVAAVRKHVEEWQLPWIILSEELSKRAGQPEYGDAYNFRGVPQIMLVDKEGKVIATNIQFGELLPRLAKIFE